MTSLSFSTLHPALMELGGHERQSKSSSGWRMDVSENVKLTASHEWLLTPWPQKLHFCRAQEAKLLPEEGKPRMQLKRTPQKQLTMRLPAAAPLGSSHCTLTVWYTKFFTIVDFSSSFALWNKWTAVYHGENRPVALHTQDEWPNWKRTFLHFQWHYTWFHVESYSPHSYYSLRAHVVSTVIKDSFQ